VAEYRLNLKKETFERNTQVALPSWNQPTIPLLQNTIKGTVVAIVANVSGGKVVETTPPESLNTTTASGVLPSAAHAPEQVVAPGNDKQSASKSLPQWTQDYITWHAQQRAQFPDQLLVTHPDAPPLSIRICPYQCGGLHDRMIGLPQFLQEASISKRIVLLKWFSHSSFELESYLRHGSIMNWTLPMVPNVTDTPNALLEFANRSSSFQQQHVVVRHVRDHTTILESEVATIKAAALIPPISFGDLWHTFFQPSPRLQQLLDDTTVPTATYYAALHLRLCHPANYNIRRDTGMDLNGLPWDRLHERQTVMEAAIRALNCTKSMLLQKHNSNTLPPLYLFSDSKEIIHFLVHEATRNDTNVTGRLARLHQVAHDLVKDWQLVAREGINAHLDTLNQTWTAYAGTFVDLYVAMQAQCLSLGVGNFAVLALLISPKDNTCVMNYIPRNGIMAKAWGYHKIKSAQVCDLPSKVV
jgi:hypothetical protein